MKILRCSKERAHENSLNYATPSRKFPGKGEEEERRKADAREERAKNKDTNRRAIASRAREGTNERGGERLKRESGNKIAISANKIRKRRSRAEKKAGAKTEKKRRTGGNTHGRGYGERVDERRSSRVHVAFVYCSLCAFRSVSFIRAFRSSQGFVSRRRPAAREPLSAKKGGKARARVGDRKEGRKESGRASATALLNQIARNNICILLRARKTPVCARSSRLPSSAVTAVIPAISSHDMDTTSPFDDPPVGLRPASRIKTHTRV